MINAFRAELGEVL